MLKYVLAPIHKDGWRFIAIFAVITVVLWWLWPPLGRLGVLATAWCIYFFRDPWRVSPQRDGLVLSPADGRIIIGRRGGSAARTRPSAPSRCSASRSS